MSAETDDEFLRNCFYEHPAYRIMSDLTDPRSLLVGSTGSGKSAIIKMIDDRCKNVSVIDLSEVAMTYINNSDAISFLRSLNVDLSPFFNYFWRHVICLSYIRLKFDVGDETSSQVAFRKLKQFMRGGDKNRERAIRYLEIYENIFWKTMDVNAKEISQQLMDSINKNLSFEMGKFSSSANYLNEISLCEKESIIRKIQSFIDPTMLSELSEVMSLLKEYDENFDESLYITIDGIDENWVGGDIKYQMINSLINSLKPLRRLDKLKLVIALRSDIFENLIRQNHHGSFQSDKYEDYIFRLRWDKDQLKELLNKRINFLFRKKYNSENVFFEDVFSTKVRNEDTLGYMLARTLLRPRDIIDFSNECFKNSKGKSNVNQSSLVRAEEIYSERRYRSLAEEWRLTFPSIKNIMREVLEHKKRRFYFKDLINEEFSNKILLCVDSNDEIFKLVDRILKSNPDYRFEDFVGIVLERLYIIGSIGVKISPQTSLKWFHVSHEPFPNILPDSSISIHPMLYEACKVSDRRRVDMA